MEWEKENRTSRTLKDAVRCVSAGVHLEKKERGRRGWGEGPWEAEELKKREKRMKKIQAKSQKKKKRLKYISYKYCEQADKQLKKRKGPQRAPKN